MAHVWVVGVDEAGRGCLAGPIFAAAVVLDPHSPVDGLADSKVLSPTVRERLATEIKAKALAWGVAMATAREIDARGIEWANRIAFTRAVRACLRRAPGIDPGLVLVEIDGTREAWRLGMRQVTIIDGDETRPPIAAASILAKTERDRYVAGVMHARFPQYGFDRHKGYGTAEHRAAIAAWGPSPYHRMSFGPLRRAAGHE